MFELVTNIAVLYYLRQVLLRIARSITVPERIKSIGRLFIVLTMPAFVGCATMRPEIAGVASTIEDISLEGVTLSVDVSVKNNAPLSITAPGGRYALKLAGNSFLSSDDVPSSSLPASDVGVIRLPAQIRYEDLWNLYAGIKDAKEIDFEMDGALAVDVLGQNFELPFAHAGMLPVLRMPKFAIADVDTSDISLTGANVTVTGNIENPNIFEVGLSKLGYNLTLGDLEVGAVDVRTADKIAPDTSGAFTLSCRISSASAVRSLLGGVSLGSVKLAPTGAIETPYGAVQLADSDE